MVEVLVTAATPIVFASYVGELIWRHKRNWYVVPKGWKLPKVEVACLASAVGSLMAVSWLLGG